MQETALQHYLNKLALHSGYIHYSPCLLGDDATEANAWQGRSWQLRIAILPEPANLLCAAKTLAPILIQAQLEFKCLVLNNPLPPIPWDGTQASFDTESDRDQRGKEICIYLRYDDRLQRYEKTPQEYKVLLLQCWYALYQAKVVLGYIPPTRGDKAIPLSEGITPFSYTAFKPYRQRHGILQQENYNPLGYLDPLDNMVLMYSDLASHRIPAIQVSDIYQTRLQYLQQHHSATMMRLIQTITELMQANPIPFTINLNNLLKTALAKPNDLTIIQHCLAFLVKHYPRNALSQLTLPAEVARLAELNARHQILLRQADVIAILNQLLTKPLTADYDSILQDFQQNPLIMHWLQQHNICTQKLSQLIHHTPASLQLLHRQLTHALYQQTALYEQQNLIITPPTTWQISHLFNRFTRWRLLSSTESTTEIQEHPSPKLN